jgi:hypothetical protein
MKGLWILIHMLYNVYILIQTFPKKNTQEPERVDTVACYFATQFALD